MGDDFEGLVPEHLYAPPEPVAVDLDSTDPEPDSPRHRGRRIVAGATVIALVVAGAWVATRHAPHGRVTIEGIAGGTVAARTARFHGEVSIATAHGVVGPAIVTDGVVDFGARSGSSTSTWDFRTIAADVAHGTGTTLPPALGVSQPFTLHQVWRGDDTWIDTDMAGAMLGRATSGQHWYHSRVTGPTDRVGLALLMPMFGGAPTVDPDSLLQSLRSSGVTLTASGHEIVRGTETTKYSADVDMAKLLVPSDGTATGDAALGVDVDSDGRARRITLSSGAQPDNEGGDLTLDFYDFGVTVDVQPPPASEVVESTPDSQSSTATTGGSDETTHVTGPWTARRDGTAAGVAWTLYQAAATNGNACYAMHTAPRVAFDQSGAEIVTDASHDGDPVACANDARESLPGLAGLAFPPELAFQSASEASVSIVVIVGVSDGTTVIASRPDGTTDSLAADHGTIVDVVPAARRAAKIVIGSGANQAVCRTTPPRATPDAILPGGSCLPAQLDDLMQGPGALSGPWTDVFHDSVGGVAVRVVHAPARAGWSCDAVVTDPAVTMSAAQMQPFTTANPTFEGRAASCGPDSPTSSVFGGFVGNVMSVLAYSASDPHVTLAVIHEPGYTHATATVGATSASLPVNADGIAVYVGPPAAKVTITLTGGGPTVTCRSAATAASAATVPATDDTNGPIAVTLPDVMECTGDGTSMPSP